MSPETSIDILMTWYQNDGGFFARRNERIAHHLSVLPTVRQVLHLEPPLHAGDLLLSLSRFLGAPDPFARHRLKDDLLRLLGWEHRPPLVRRTPFVWIPQTQFAQGPLASWNRRQAEHQIKRWARLMGLQDPLLWLYPPSPFAEWVAEIFPGARVVCDCVDNVPAVSWLSSSQRERFRESYRRLLSRAEKVFAVSSSLAESLKGYRSDIVVIPNGVDIPESPPAARCPSAHFPVLGYIGTVDERVDRELIVRIVSERPGWSLLMIGPVKDLRFWRTSARAFPNLRMVGPVPWEESGTLLESFDVALLPHRVTPYTRSMDPLKIYRYLAAGKPVVATPLIPPDRFGGLVEMADPNDFIRTIEDVLKADSAPLQLERRQAMRAHCWEERVREMIQCLGLP